MVKKWYDYETESGDELMLSPRMHFRNMVKVREIMGFPFNLTVSGDLYKEPFDVYTFQDDEIIVMGSDAHCHVGNELGKYKEVILFFCDESNRDKLIKQIRKVV